MRSEKIAIEREARERFDGVKYLFVVAYDGMKVAQMDALRRQLRQERASFWVFKNTVLRRAAADRGWPAPFRDGLRGMLGVVTGDDPVATARALQRFGVENKVAAVRGGILDNQLLSADEVVAMATLPSLEQLRGQLVGALAAPIAGLVGVLGATQSQLVRVLKAVEEKKSAA